MENIFKKRSLVRRGRAEKITLAVCFVIFFLYALTLIFPFIWIGYNSLKLNGYTDFVKDVWGLPQNPIAGLSNYAKVFQMSWSGYTFLDMTFNTLEYVVILTLVGVLVPLQTSYVVAQYRFKLRKVYYAVAIMTISVPVVGGLASMIILLTKLKLFGTYVGIYVMGASGFGGSFLLFYSFFRSMSWSYAESAFIDGAGHFRVFVSINLPMAVPIIVSVMILSFLASWNDYFNVYMYAKGRPTLAVGIQFLGEMMMSQNRYPELFAFMMVVMVPGLVIFGVFQRTIMGNVSIGGLKG